MVTGFDIISTNKALQEHWLRRFIAIIIDGVIISVIVWLIGWLVLLGPFWWAFQGLIWWGIAMLYFVVLEMSVHASLGKKLMSLEVVATEGELDVGSIFLRNVSKFMFFVVIDWFVGIFTEGDPRQKFTDRFAKTTVQRTDEKAYQEQQFRQMAYVPPHPTPHPHPHPHPPPPGPGAPPFEPGAVPPAGPPPAGPTPQPTEEAPRFCQYCGSTLTLGADGKASCSRCGRTF